jgi:hypothetical protein
MDDIELAILSKPLSAIGPRSVLFLFLVLMTYICIWSNLFEVRVGEEFVMIDPDSLRFGDGYLIITLHRVEFNVSDNDVGLLGDGDAVLGYISTSWCTDKLIQTPSVVAT